jgi:hypothetical protein
MYISIKANRGSCSSDANPGLVVSRIILEPSLSGEPGWLGANPLGRGGGRDVNYLIGTQIQILRMSGSLMGSQVAQVAEDPLCHFVPRSVCFGRC